MAIPRVTLPLELMAEVATPSGTRYQWGSNRPGEERFRNFGFNTAIGEGFGDGSCQFARPYDRDFPDVKLLNVATFVGADGMVAYEGRIGAIPREVGDAHSVGVTLAGLMANASDRKFSEIYVDRVLNEWTGPSLGRQTAVLTSNYVPQPGTVVSDVADATSGVVTAFNDVASPFLPVSDAWYDAGPGLTISRIDYSWRVQPGGLNPADVGYNWVIGVSSDDKATATSTTANLRSAGPSASSFSPTVRYRYGLLQILYTITGPGTAGGNYGVAWYNLAVYGNSGLTLYPGETGQPPGVRAADVIRDVIGRYCPKLTAGNIANADYTIQHLAFKDGVTPFEAMQQVNKYHLYNLAVWEDGRLDWTPFDLSDYDWQVSAGVDATVSLQGPSTDSFYNGIVVRYDDVLSSRKDTLTPDVYAELRDLDPNNPWNESGVDRWMELDLSYPHTQGGALQAGVAALADMNRAKSPGSITVHGYVRDRAGNRQPGWKVRAGDTVAVVNHPNDAPRLIHHTAWDDTAKTMTLSVDAPPSSLAAQQDRVQTALKARGLLG